MAVLNCQDTSTSLSERSAGVLAIPLLVYSEEEISEGMNQPVWVMQAGAREEFCK